jgi:hypothetical protein
LWGVDRAISGDFVVCRQGRKKVGRRNPLIECSVRCVTNAANASGIAIRSYMSPGVKHDLPAVGRYDHILIRIVAFPSATPSSTPGQDISVIHLAQALSLPPSSPCRLSSRSQRLLASSLPQTGPTVPLPVLAVFPNLDSPGTAERSTFAASAANRHLARVNASCSLSCQRPGSR